MTLWQERILPLFVSKGMEKSNEIADAIGCNVRLVYHWNKDGYTSYNKYYPQIAKALGVSVEYLRGESEDITPAPTNEDGLSEKQIKLIQLIRSMSPLEVDLLLAQAKIEIARRKSQD